MVVYNVQNNSITIICICNVTFLVTFNSCCSLKVMRVREYFVFIYFLFQLPKPLPLLHLSFCPQHSFHPTLMGEFLSINLDLFCAWLIVQTCILSWFNRSLAMVQDTPLWQYEGLSSQPQSQNNDI